MLDSLLARKDLLEDNHAASSAQNIDTNSQRELDHLASLVFSFEMLLVELEAPAATLKVRTG
jgi:hypothetical protein